MSVNPSKLDLKLLENQTRSVWYNRMEQEVVIPYRDYFNPIVATSYKADKSVYFSYSAEETLTAKEYSVSSKELCIELFELPFRQLDADKKKKAYNYYGTLYDMIITFKYIYPLFFFACGRFIRWSSIIVVSQFGKFYCIISSEGNNSTSYIRFDGFIPSTGYPIKELKKIKENIEVPSEGYYSIDNNIAADDNDMPIIYSEYYNTRNRADVATYVLYDDVVYKEDVEVSSLTERQENLLLSFTKYGYFYEPGTDLPINTNNANNTSNMTLIYKNYVNVHSTNSNSYSYISFNSENSNLLAETIVPVETSTTNGNINRLNKLDGYSLGIIDKEYPIYENNIMIFTEGLSSASYPNNCSLLNDELDISIYGGNILSVDYGKYHSKIIAKVFYSKICRKGYSEAYNISTPILSDYIKKINNHLRQDDEQPWSDVPDYILNLLYDLNFRLRYYSTASPSSLKSWESQNTTITDTNKIFALNKITEIDETLLSDIDNDKYYYKILYGKYISDNLDDNDNFVYELKNSNIRCIVFYNGTLMDETNITYLSESHSIQIYFGDVVDIADDDILDIECFESNEGSQTYEHISSTHTGSSSYSITLTSTIYPGNIISFINGLYIPQTIISRSGTAGNYSITMSYLTAVNTNDIIDLYIIPCYTYCSKNNMTPVDSYSTVFKLPSILSKYLPLSRNDTFVFADGLKLPPQYINYISSNVILIRANMTMDTISVVKHTWYNNSGSDSIENYVKNNTSKKSSSIDNALSTISIDLFKRLIDDNKSYGRTPPNNA